MEMPPVLKKKQEKKMRAAAMPDGRNPNPDVRHLFAWLCRAMQWNAPLSRCARVTPPTAMMTPTSHCPSFRSRWRVVVDAVVV